MPSRRRDLYLPPIRLDRHEAAPLHRQIELQLRRGIESGAIPAGARLPSSRKLARLLGISRNTVLAAYDRLAADGQIRGECGSGVRVCAPGPLSGAHFRPLAGPGRLLDAPPAAALLGRLRQSAEGDRSARVASRLPRIVRAAGYPARTLRIADPDGNSLYLNY